MDSIKPYPKYLTPLALSYQTTQQFTDESVIDFYDVFISKLLKDKVVTSNGTILTITKKAKVEEEQQLLEFFQTLQFILPVSLYGVNSDVTEFCQKTLDKIHTLWPLTEDKEMVPELKILVDNSLPISFVEPRFKEEIDPGFLRDLLTSLRQAPVYREYDPIENKILEETGKKYDKEAEKNFVENNFLGLKKYITSTALFSVKGISISAPKIKWHILALMIILITGSIVASNITTALGALVTITSFSVVGIILFLWLGVYLMNKDTYIALLTPEGKLLQAQLSGWERFLENTPNHAEYELDRPDKVVKPWSPYRARRR